MDKPSLIGAYTKREDAHTAQAEAEKTHPHAEVRELPDGTYEVWTSGDPDWYVNRFGGGRARRP